MTEHLRPPRFADQVVVFDHAAMTLKIPAALQDEDEMLMRETDQLRQVACARFEMIFHEIDSTFYFSSIVTFKIASPGGR